MWVKYFTKSNQANKLILIINSFASDKFSVNEFLSGEILNFYWARY